MPRYPRITTPPLGVGADTPNLTRPPPKRTQRGLLGGGRLDKTPSYPGITTSRFGLETNTQTFTSPLTKSTQRVLLGGARWNTTLSLPAMNRTQAGPWQAFFLLLEGGANTFNAFDPDCKAPRGIA